MAQLTVNMGSEQQRRFDRFCALSGKTPQTAFNDMMDMWERLVYHPWTSFMENEKRRLNAYSVYLRQRQKAERGETQDLSMDEIDLIISEVRSARSTNNDAV